MKKQLGSFKHAIDGFISAISTESHLRFHIVAAVYVFVFAYLGGFDPTEWTTLIITVCTVISAELVNTAVERLCDLYTKDYDKNIKFIKDIAACAVLVFAVGAAVIALFLFIGTGKLLDAFNVLLSHPLMFIPLALSAVASVCFIVLPGRKNKTEK